MEWNGITWFFVGMVSAHRGFELVLDLLQLGHLARRKQRVPAHLDGKVDLETIRKAVRYNRDKLHFGLVSSALGIVELVLMIGFGFQWIDEQVTALTASPLVAGLAFFGILGLLDSLVKLPLQLYSTFRLEERHGFNRQTLGGFALDKVKELLLSAVLGGLLLTVVLLIMSRAGDYWWLIAFVGVTLIQLFLTWIYPVAIMPLFNRFTPVEEDLAIDVSALADRVGFPLAGVMVMDGSKRSTHSNAFIVGLKGARRIVFYDTLIDKIDRPALLSVLAHELGHFKLGHLRKRLLLGLIAMGVLFGAMALLRDQAALYTGLGFARLSDHAFLVVFGLLASETFGLFGWFFRYRSRRDEHAADRFAVEAVSSGEDLASALVTLTKQNLSSPGSHRLYRAYHNSHPALKQRLVAIRRHADVLGFAPEPQLDSTE